MKHSDKLDFIFELEFREVGDLLNAVWYWLDVGLMDQFIRR